MKWMIIPIFVFSLIACVTTPERENEWVKPGATQHDYHVDSGQCKAQGFSVPWMSLIQAGIVYASCIQGKGLYLQEKLSAYDYFNNGYSANERGDYNQAIADYSKAIEYYLKVQKLFQIAKTIRVSDL